jgi:hypothetical protein
MRKAGFYPDPSKRYANRYWSGTEWTERVSGSGGEYEDPVRQAFAAPIAQGPWAIRSVAAALRTMPVPDRGWRTRLPMYERTALEWAIGYSVALAIFGVAAWFGLIGWVLLASVIYFTFAWITVQFALRTMGATHRGRITLIAYFTAIVPAAAVLWPPLHSVGFQPHGSWTNIVCALVHAGNCKQ